ncbi:MAG: hypothetical protein KC731_20630 [Myxococcales bacterium]|nr:hypothetical protein [Myxococcales bacterium]
MKREPISKPGLRSTTLSRRGMTLALALGVPLGVLGLSACRDKEAELKAKMMPALDEVMPLIERDTKQVREGLPKGAELMAKHLDEDPRADLEGVKRAIANARAGVDELEVAKSTFFVFVAPDGVVLRGETEPDLPAGKSLVEAVPDAKKIFGSAGLTEVWGYMEGLRGVNKGDDLQWIVGHPVKGKEGKVLGAFVTGWSLRKYAEYLENHVKVHLTKTAEDPAKPIPLAYAFVVKGKRAFGGPVTPDENAKAVAELDLVAKTAGGAYEGSIELDGRAFLVAAKPAPTLGKDVVVALLMSPI